MINDQGFPRPRKLGNSSVWDREEIDQFMEALPMMVIPRLDWAKKKQEK
jgi:predicted DNA-binding transcriptional regulator AlpA